MSIFSHTPVLLGEVIAALNIEPGRKYIDATLGGGGHTKQILAKKGIVLGIDQDEDALLFVKEDQRLKIEKKELLLWKGNFRDIKKAFIETGFDKVNGILFDLGVSSYQMDNPTRGFGIRSLGKLDMRMDKGSTLSAYEVVNKYSNQQLYEIFLRYGEEHNAKEIAHRIVEERKKSPIVTVKELADLVSRVSHKPEPIHPATRVFQAIRIEVNDELNALKEGLQSSLEILAPGGRIVVISFHSLEDRIVKQMFERWRLKNRGKVLMRKPISATFEETLINKRSRSAKLRVFEKEYA